MYPEFLAILWLKTIHLPPGPMPLADGSSSNFPALAPKPHPHRRLCRWGNKNKRSRGVSTSIKVICFLGYLDIWIYIYIWIYTVYTLIHNIHIYIYIYMGIHTQPINNSKYWFVQKWDVPNIPNIPGEFPKFERFAPEFALPYIIYTYWNQLWGY